MNRRHLLLVLPAMALLPAAASAHEFRTGDIEIFHPWSRATGQTRPGVGYMRIINHGQQADRLIAAVTRIADHAMVHANVIENGVAKMTVVEGLEIPPGGEVTLAPKSDYHLMFMGLKQPLAKGDTFPVTLIFEHAGRIDVSFVTESAGATESH